MYLKCMFLLSRSSLITDKVTDKLLHLCGWRSEKIVIQNRLGYPRIQYTYLQPMKDHSR